MYNFTYILYFTICIYYSHRPFKNIDRKSLKKAILVRLPKDRPSDSSFIHILGLKPESHPSVGYSGHIA